MTTQQPEALRLANILRSIDARSHFANESLSSASAALENQHARITELESQLAQRFDAADMATAAAQGFMDGATAPAQPVAAPATRQGGAYAALPVPNYPKSGGFPGTFAEAQMRAFADATHALRASHGQAPAGAAEELALTRQTNLAVVQRLQAKINALEAELDASRKAESQVQSYADDLDRRAQYDADNLADACGGYGGGRI